MAELSPHQELAQLARALKAHLTYQRRLGQVGQRFFQIPERVVCPGPVNQGQAEQASQEFFQVPEGVHPEGLPQRVKLTLEDVRQELGECIRCKLSRFRKKIVFGVGCERARLVLVGEAPGREEDLQGEPFVGAAGALLTQILKAIELTRKEVYITNVVKCRPPENRNPQGDEIAACEPFLLKQLEVIMPNFIVALGNFATQTLLKTDNKISNLRGRFYDYQGIRLLPTYHPAFLLRNPNMKGQVWEDFKHLKREYDKIRPAKTGGAS